MNLPGVALQQHLGDARRTAEVAVNLERRGDGEQGGQRWFCEQSEQVLVSLPPVFQPRPEVDDPRPAPARVPTAIFKPVFERLARGRGQIWRSARRDLIARVEREQMRDVAMSRVRLFVLLRPF